MLEHALHAPETAAGDHGGLDADRTAWVSAAGAGMITASSAALRGRDRECSDGQRADGGGAKRKSG